MNKFQYSGAVIFQVEEKQVVRLKCEYQKLRRQFGLRMPGVAVRRFGLDKVVFILG